MTHPDRRPENHPHPSPGTAAADPAGRVAAALGLLRDLGRELGLWRPSAPVRVLGDGEENLTLEVAGTHVARFAKGPAEARPAAVRSEAALLAELAVRTAVPVPRPAVVLPEHGVLVYPRLAGVPALDAPPVGARPLVGGIADVLAATHAIGDAAGHGPDPCPPAEWLAEAETAFGRVAHLLSADQGSAVRRFLERPPPSECAEPLLGHCDLGAEHLLVAPDGALSGVIDWSDAAIADPAWDVGRVHRDLGPEAARHVVRLLGLGHDVLERAAFHARCAWLEDLAYAAEDPARERWMRNARRTFGHVFAPP